MQIFRQLFSKKMRYPDEKKRGSLLTSALRRKPRAPDVSNKQYGTITIYPPPHLSCGQCHAGQI